MFSAGIKITFGLYFLNNTNEILSNWATHAYSIKSLEFFPKRINSLQNKMISNENEIISNKNKIISLNIFFQREQKSFQRECNFCQQKQIVF